MYEYAVCYACLSQDQGIGVYFNIPNHPVYKDWQYIGPVLLTHPTASFRAPWYNQIDPLTPAVQMGLSVEAAAHLATLQISDQTESERALDSARGIAKHLYDFMSSYAQSGKVTGQGDVLIVPTDCIDRWYKKFEDKHRREPFFWLRKDITAKVQ